MIVILVMPMLYFIKINVLINALLELINKDKLAFLAIPLVLLVMELDQIVAYHVTIKYYSLKVVLTNAQMHGI